MRKVHSEGVRERNNMKNNAVTHQLEPKGTRPDGREIWCCRSCKEKAEQQE